MSGDLGAPSGPGTPSRGQLVVAMAVVVTVALVPVAAAYLQLGFVGAGGGTHDDGAASAVTALDQAVSGVEGDIAGQYTWTERGAAVQRTRTLLRPRIRGIESAGGSETRAVAVSYNQTLADRVAVADCPGPGPGRTFGSCEARRGVVVQERAGEAVLVGVAMDVRVVSPGGTTSASVVLGPGAASG